MNQLAMGGFSVCVAALALGCSSNSYEPAGGAGGAATAGASSTAGSSNTAGSTSGGSGGSSGSMAVGGTPGAGGSMSGAGTGGSMSGAGAGGATVKVTACDALGPAGQWEDITPSEVDLTTSGTTHSNANFGTAALRLNPQDPAQIYLGTETWGFFGSSDCGSTWTKLNTGRGASDMDNGNQWTMAVDPLDPQVIYSNSGFATGGVFKSTNGGVDWDNVLTESTVKGDIPYSAIPYAGFIGTFSMDPNDHLHLLSSFHSGCNSPATSMCFIETLDGGGTWKVRNIVIEGVSGGEHTLVEFLTSERWLFGTQSGVYISDDSGGTWTAIPGVHSIVHHQQTYRTADGHFFQSTWEGLMYSPDGAHDNWTLLPGSPVAAVGVAGNGTHVWTSFGGPWQAPCTTGTMQPYHVTSETSPGTMTQVESPMMGDGGLFMAYDTVHHVLYSSNFCGGTWRVVID